MKSEVPAPLVSAIPGVPGEPVVVQQHKIPGSQLGDGLGLQTLQRVRLHFQRGHRGVYPPVENSPPIA